MEDKTVEVLEQSIVHYNGMWTCKLCEYTTGKKDHMRTHINVKHIKGISHQCNKCGK